KQLNTWVSFQSAEQPLLGQFSVSGNTDRLRRRFKCTGNSMMLLGEVQNFSKIFFAPAALNA
ncbi:hypothetical protein LZK35_23290, partial [Pseudomonas aeruginosa]|nr:hypothetical protein [Pseudomonas aeruginosa]